MKINIDTKTILFIALSALMLIATSALAQEYISPKTPALRGRSPGVKVKLISENGATKTYAIIFAVGDEILSGLSEFAEKYQVKSAHFTGIGDVTTAKIGWFDGSKKMFKVTNITEQSEVTSLMGDVALNNGKVVVHAHINLASSDNIVRGGHLLEGFVSPTLEVIFTVEPEPLYKKLDPEFDLFLIDPTIK
jgi:predicted DNA-binding protein with PD1-like motif